MQNDTQSTGRRKLLIIGVVVLVLIFIIGAFLFSRRKSPTTIDNTAQTATLNSVVSITDWGVEFPATKSGDVFTDIGTDTTAFVVPSTGANVEEKFIIVRGINTSDNVCTQPFAASAIYRHKEENPGIDYSVAFNLNNVTVTKVKVGDWWYSTTSIITDGECFPTGKSESADYLQVAKQYFTDFSKMKATNN